MLDVAVHNVSLRILRDVTLTFERSTHVAVTGPPGCGATTLLNVIAGVEKPERGLVQIGTGDVTKLGVDKRPLLHVTAALDVPERWSIEHALVNAVRTRTLDRVDRLHELKLAAEKWQLDLTRKIATLSDSEKARVHLARIELKKPAIVVADKLLRDAPHLANEFYRTLRVLGTTFITAPATVAELGLTDRVIVLDRGGVAQQGTAAEIFSSPENEAAAIATGETNIVPAAVVREWTGDDRFTSGRVVIRPDAFEIARRGEDSDLVFGIEEATFENGRWIARGLLTGGIELRIALPAAERVHKGKLLALRVDSKGCKLISG